MISPEKNKEFSDEIENFIISNRLPDQKIKDIPGKNQEEEYKEVTFKLLNHDHQLKLLESHQNAATIPQGLKANIRSTVSLPLPLKNKWNETIHSCGKALLGILVEYHKKNVVEYAAQRTSLKEKFSTSKLTSLNKFIIEEHNIKMKNKSDAKRKLKPQLGGPPSKKVKNQQSGKYQQHSKNLQSKQQSPSG